MKFRWRHFRLGTASRFEPKTLSLLEGARLQQLWMYIAVNNSGYGVCNSCRGGLAASKK